MKLVTDKKHVNFIAWLLLCSVLVINKWTMQFFFASYVGQGLSLQNSLIISILDIFVVLTGLAILKHGLSILYEMLVLLVFLVPFAINAIRLSLLPENPVDNISYHAEILSILFYSVLILLLNRAGLYIVFILQSLVAFFLFTFISINKFPIEPSSFFVMFKSSSYMEGYLWSHKTLLFWLFEVAVFVLLILLVRRSNIKRMKLYFCMLLLLVAIPLIDRNYRKGFSDNFFVKLLTGHREYKLFQEQSEEFRQKVWPHMVNSIGKLKETSMVFSGIELDVVYNENKNIFDVTHPPVESIGLDLEKYWAGIDAPKDKCFWVDLKNLTSSNSNLAVQRLIFLADKYSLSRKKIIVESGQAVLLLPFKENGFYTSYYLPSNIIRGISGKAKNTLNQKDIQNIETIRNIFLTSKVDAVSTNSRNYDFIKDHLPQVKEILLWNMDVEFYCPGTIARLASIINSDRRIKVLLVEYRSIHDR